MVLKARGPRKLRKPLIREDLRGVVDETVALFYRLRWLTDRIYAGDGLSNARRGILRGLVQFGPQTVPQLARARSVSRQHIQLLVDALARRSLVELVANPAHRRSKLVRPTHAGAAHVREMDETNRRVVSSVAAGLSVRELAITARTLRAVRLAFESERRWRRALAQ